MQSSLQTTSKNINILSKVFTYYNINHSEFDELANSALYKTELNFDSSKGFLFTTLLKVNMKNACRNYLKKNYFFITNKKQMPDEIGKKEPSKEELLIKDCLDSLPDEYRNILQQRYYQSMTFVEIAEYNGYTLRTAFRHISKAEEALKKLFLED